MSDILTRNTVDHGAESQYISDMLYGENIFENLLTNDRHGGVGGGEEEQAEEKETNSQMAWLHGIKETVYSMLGSSGKLGK